MGLFSDLKDSNLYFSKLTGIPVYSEDGIFLGKVKDFFVDYEEIFPVVMALQIKKNRILSYFNWSDIKKFTYKKITISNDSRGHRSRTYPKISNEKVLTSFLANQFTGKTINYPPLGKVILDRQIVDTSGKKVVRVNDIQFIKVGPFLRVTHAAIGVRSMIRRLGYELVVDSVIKAINKNSKYLTRETLINWKYVHAIPDRTFQKNVRLSLDNEEIKNIHPADLADILEDLDGHARELLFSNLEPELAAETLSEMEEDLQTILIKKEDPDSAAKILENMDPDEAVDILDDLKPAEVKDIIERISDNEVREDIEELLNYDEDTAGGLMSTEVFEVHADQTKEDLLSTIQNEHEEFESIYDIFVIDKNEKLIGTCPLNKILIQKENLPIGDLMNSKDIKSLKADVHWKEVAEFMSKYNLINVPIVDTENELLGIVSVDDILPWLLDERS